MGAVTIKYRKPIWFLIGKIQIWSKLGDEFYVLGIDFKLFTLKKRFLFGDYFN